MGNGSDSGAETPAPTDPPTPKPASPKRGAMPTPKSEIEQAKPYVPDIGEVEGGFEAEPELPTDVGGEHIDGEDDS